MFMMHTEIALLQAALITHSQEITPFVIEATIGILKQIGITSTLVITPLSLEDLSLLMIQIT